MIVSFVGRSSLLLRVFGVTYSRFIIALGKISVDTATKGSGLRPIDRDMSKTLARLRMQMVYKYMLSNFPRTRHEMSIV